MRQATARLLAAESADWLHRGLIDLALADRLGRRYDRRGAAMASLVTWLGLFAMLLLGGAVLSTIGYMAQSAAVGVVLLGAVSVGLWFGGVRMATEPAQRHAVTGSALVTIGLAALFGAMALAVLSVDETLGERSAPIVLLLTGLAGVGTAYRYRLRWPLLLALLCCFHALGAWHEYAGGGEYVADIQDPPVMAAVAAACAGFGLWHLQAEEGSLARYPGFGRLYVIFGLLYLDCSLWFLSLGFYGDGAPLAWILGFSAVCIGQIVLGARLKDPRLTGFGIVFLGIDLYTRFFEQLWERMSAGGFFLACGLAGMLCGWLFERQAGRAAS
jgi:uncharacterized membrane protein